MLGLILCLEHTRLQRLSLLPALRFQCCGGRGAAILAWETEASTFSRVTGMHPGSRLCAVRRWRTGILRSLLTLSECSMERKGALSATMYCLVDRSRTGETAVPIPRFANEETGTKWHRLGEA